MIVYVESNFVLELALEQEQHAACRSILALGESGAVSLVIPAFSIAEPYQTQFRRFSDRKELHRRLSDELGLLGRTQSYQANIAGMRVLSDLLLTSQADESRRLRSAVDSILAVAEVIPLDLNVIRHASAPPYGLGVFDGLVFASVAAHIEEASGEKCFVSRDKHFDDPQLKAFLASHSCRTFSNFADAGGFLVSTFSS